MIHQSTKKIKSFTPPTKFEDMKRFLELTPVPPELAHLETALRKISLRVFLDLVANAAAAGLNDDQIADGVCRMAEFSERTQQRCTTCLHWADEYHTLCAAGDGQVDIFAICERCSKRIDRSHGTNTMRRNLFSYGLGAN